MASYGSWLHLFIALDLRDWSLITGRWGYITGGGGGLPNTSGCLFIKIYEHYRLKKHCIKELRTVLKCQKVYVNDIILCHQ